MNPNNKNPRKALLICYYFPPLLSSGVQRSVGFSRFLSEFGWEPLVLSVKNSKDPWTKSINQLKLEDTNIIRTPEFGLGQLADFLHAIHCRIYSFFLAKELSVNYFRKFLCLPDPQIAWLSTWKAFRIKNEYDLIYASCSPFSSAISASLIKLLIKKPLVLDFRDPWPQTVSISELKLIQYMNILLEKFCIRSADHVVLNTEGTLKFYSDKYPKYAHKFSCIPNGFDQIVRSSKDTSSRPTLTTIMHLGNFYGKRTPKSILEALLKLNHPEIEFVQVGEWHEDFNYYKDKIKFRHIPPCSHEESLKHMASADILYVKQGTSASKIENTAIAAKTYEYLTTGIPILCQAPEGDNSDLIKMYANYAKTLENENPEELSQAILEIYKALPNIQKTPKQEFLDYYNRQSLTKKLALLFNSLFKQ